MKFEENDSSPNGLLANFNGIRITKRMKYMFSATGTHQLLTLVSQLDQFNLALHHWINFESYDKT
jgi:hypothetical protein